MLGSYFSDIKHSVLKLGQSIRLLICDVDGVLSNGSIYIGNNGEEFKSFNVKDGYGIVSLLAAGIEVAIITSRKSKLVENRAKELGITYCLQGQLNKLDAYQMLCSQLELSSQQIAYIGDDLVDLPIMQRVGLPVAVNDAHPLLIPSAQYVTKLNGGHGAVRELCDLILFSQSKLHKFQGLSL